MNAKRIAPLFLALALVGLLVSAAAWTLRHPDANWRRVMQDRNGQLPESETVVPKTDPPPMKDADVSYGGDLCWLASPTWDRNPDISWVPCAYDEADKGYAPKKSTRLSQPNT